MFRRPRLLFAVHVGLFLGTVVACYLTYRARPPASTQVVSEPDHLLRRHLGLRSFQVLYRFPDGKDHLSVVRAEIRDGTPVPGPPRGHFSREQVGGPELRLEMVWGKVNGTMTVTDGWSWNTSPRSDGFWESINALHTYGRDAKKPVWQGYEVVAFGESDARIEPGGELPDAA